LWTWNGAGGEQGVEGERAEVVVDPRLEDVSVGVDRVVDGVVVPEAGVGAGGEARPSGGDENVPQLPNENVAAVLDETTRVQEIKIQPSMPQTAPITEDHAA